MARSYSFFNSISRDTRKRVFALLEVEGGGFTVAMIRPVEEEEYLAVVVMSHEQAQSFLYTLEPEAENWIVEFNGTQFVSTKRWTQVNLAIAHFMENGC
jgi:hypothetical protein